jgi:hypothetical protein
MPKPTTKSRQELRSRFVRNAIPTEADFTDLIGASLNQADDGLLKLPDQPLGLVRQKTDQPVLRFFADPAAEGAAWQVQMGSGDKPDFALAGPDGRSALVVDGSTGNVGIGTDNPGFRLDVNGPVRLGGFTVEDKDEWPWLVWCRDSAKGWDEGLIKHGSRRGFFARAGFGVHVHESRSFELFSTGWNPLFGVEGGTGNTVIRGHTTLLTGSNPIRFSAGWSSFPDDKTNGAEISNDTGTYKTLMIVGNKSGGDRRRVGIWDVLNVWGRCNVMGLAHINQAAIKEPENSCHLEVYAPDSGDVGGYTKIRFHQGNQYWGWMGYHGLSQNNLGEFVFWNINQGREARTRCGELVAKGAVVRSVWANSGNGPNDENDMGRIVSRTLRVNKLFADTALRVFYCDNFRVNGDNVACRWEIRVDGNSVSPPIIADRYESQGNRHIHGTVMGYARGVSAGVHEIQIWLVAHPHNGGRATDVYTGWSGSTWSLEAEEVWMA